MAKVSKSVREKRKDFSKTKLKVGKTKQLPANHTDTSFKSKAVVLPKQSVNREAAEKDSRTLEHFIALLSHKSGDIRKDAVQQLTSHLTAHPPSLSTTITPLMKALAPMIIDDTTAVRKALLEHFNGVLSRLPRRTLDAHVDLLLLYIRGAMTHISNAIRADSTKFLSWTMSRTAATELIVSTQLHEFLETFSTLLGLKGGGSSGVIRTGRAVATHLTVLNTLLTAALEEAVPDVVLGLSWTVPVPLGDDVFLPHRSTRGLLAPCTPLGLFDAASTVDTDRSARHILAPHLPGLSRYLANIFTDAVNGTDHALCLPVVELVRTLSSNRSDEEGTGTGTGGMAELVDTVHRGVARLQEAGHVPQGLVGVSRCL